MSQAELARRVGVTSGQMSKIVNGKSATFWKRGPKWCDVLKLDEPERQEFLEAMQVAASPPLIPVIITRLERRALGE